MGAVKEAMLEVMEQHAETLEKLAQAEQREKGAKFDEGKEPLDLLPYDALVEVAKVLAFGEQKYETANWTKGIEQRRLISAALRHLYKFNNGEDHDTESGINHLAHSACNLLFAIWMYKNRPDMDNRWAPNVKKSLPRITEIE